jgi:KaiC/GvpD/RAD55 family RecA-like ATPase
LPPRKRESDERTEIRRDISSVVEKLVTERLGKLQDSVLLGNRLFRKPEFNKDEASYLGDNVMPSVQARITMDRSDFELGESFQVRIQLQNIRETPVSIARIDALIPPDFELSASPNSYKLVSTYLNLQDKRLAPYATENIDVTLRSTRKGTFLLAPRIIYTNSIGLQTSCEPEPVYISVSETILPNRIKTGFQDLDNLLFGGLPQNSAVILTSISCDERDLLVKRFLEAGAKEGNTTFCAIIDPEGIRSLAEGFKDNFHVLVCNSSIDEDFEKLPNVSKVAGVENLTDVNIALEAMLRKFGDTRQLEQGRRACLEILSDILLEHGAVQTRKWLSRLIPELRSKGFTTLAVVNPHMHSSEQLHAILDLFDGEISIYEKGENDLIKYLRIRKMHRQRYLESELPLRKTRLMTTPLTLSCCRRTFNL